MAGSRSMQQAKKLLPSDDEWLYNMTENHSIEEEVVDQTPHSNRRMGRAPRTLREVKSNETCFDPSVVSFGPYHHDRVLLKPMERHKEAAAIWFFSKVATSDHPVVHDNDNTKHGQLSDRAKTIYQEFVTEATRKSTLRDWYVADESTDKMTDEEFNRMMFLDGCFILYFVMDQMPFNRFRLRKNNHLHELFIVRDMFLLENQIPFEVLIVLSKLMRKLEFMYNFIDRLISTFFFPPDSAGTAETYTFGFAKGHSIFITGHEMSSSFHLLDILKYKFTGDRTIIRDYDFKNYYFRSIMEHKAAGIRLCKGDSNQLKAISFHEGFIFGYLSLPPIVVNRETKSWVLNLIAYEMSPGLPGEPGAITACINLLVSLIQHHDDVKELRSKGILLNRLGSDKEVAKLFKEMGRNLMSKLLVYGDIMEEIQKHYEKRQKVWIGNILHTNFSSPLTLSVLAGVFLLVLTVIQTVFTVWPQR